MRTVFATGANGGLGRETVKCLVEDGVGKVVMACRSQERAEEAREQIMSEVEKGHDTAIVALGGYDMTDPEAICEAVEALPRDLRFDTVFLGSGGVVFDKTYQTVAWNGKDIEKTVFQNVIGGHVVLSHLIRRNLLVPGTRVVVAGGEGARGIPGMIANPDFQTPNEIREYVFSDFSSRPKYNPMDAIGISKLLSALWVRKIARFEDLELEIVWFSPGLTSGTSGTAGLPPLQEWFMQSVVFGVLGWLGKAQGPRAGGRKFADCIEGKIGKNGDLIASPKGKTLGALVDQSSMNSAFNDHAMQDEVWALLEEVCGPFAGK